MYRRVEAGDVNEMTLHPSVYRDVLNAYRETTPANIEDVLTAIQKLPDELLYRSRWLSRRALSAKENAQLEIVLKELRIGSQLSEVEKKELTEKIYKSYLDLHAAGITESDDNLELIGGSYTAGFWKSYVEVEKRKAWIWNDNIFDQVFATEVTRSVIRATKAHMMATGTYESSAERALSLIREGKHPSKITPQAALDMIVIASRGKESNADTEVDAILHFVREGTPKIFTLRYIGSTEDAIEKRVREFVQSRREILQAYGATMKLDEAKVWTLPSDEEVHRIGRIAKVNVPEHFGPHEYERAISKFSEGNVDATISIFERMLQDLEDPTIRNNLTFCYLLKGQFDKAEVHTQAILSRIVNKEKDSEDPYDPLWEMNFALLLHLQGKIDKAKEHLTAALAWVKEQKYEEDLAYALVLRKDHRTVTPVQGLPRGAALLLNLHGVGQINLSEAIEQLKQLYSEVPEHWLQLMDVSTNSHY